MTGRVCFTGLTDASSLSSDVTLGDIGLDSLMGVEVKQTLERDFEICLSMKEIRGLTIKDLRRLREQPAASSPMDSK